MSLNNLIMPKHIYGSLDLISIVVVELRVI